MRRYQAGIRTVCPGTIMGGSVSRASARVLNPSLFHWINLVTVLDLSLSLLCLLTLTLVTIVTAMLVGLALLLALLALLIGILVKNVQEIGKLAVLVTVGLMMNFVMYVVKV